MNEEWRDVVGYEGYYQVSNLGRVKSLERIDSNKHLVKERILKQSMRGKYLKVELSRSGSPAIFSVHRLVAKAFSENKENKPVVNHINEDKLNNNADNLEWVTYKENSNHGTVIDRRVKKRYIPIKVIYQDNTYEIWESATVFAKEYGNGVTKQNIVAVLKGRSKTHAGLRFEYV